MVVRFFETESGASPVVKHLDGLDRREAARVLAVLADIEVNGLDSSSATLRHVEGRLWEIKVSQQRVFYVLVKGPTLWLLHAYKKQGQKAPTREIKIAKRRMKVVLAAEGEEDG